MYFATTTSPRGIAIVDTNGDGHDDLIVPGYGNVTTLLNRGVTLFGFLDETTLTWPAVSGALSYNVYRGMIADLVDCDGDGLPDAGYGTCQNALDPDTTDLEYVDAELPEPGGGFFYLASVEDYAGERDLGSTSAGLPRIPTAGCP